MIKLMGKTKAYGFWTSEYEGLKADVPNLPKNPVNNYNNPNMISTGSTFYAIDTKEDYEFEEGSNSWYQQ